MTGNPVLTVETPAKVNLTLEVLGKRPDDYHEISSVMQAVSIFDSLTFSAAEELRLETDASGLDTRDNLVYRAADLLKEKTGVIKGALIRLCKGIPVAAGLGGGSSDAAATLLGLNRLWGLQLAEEDLGKLAAQLGSDVPFFLSGGTALTEGRGEQITTLPALPTSWLVLSFRSHGHDNKTAAAYQALSSGDYSYRGHTTRLVSHIRNGLQLNDISLFNSFDGVATSLFPGIEKDWKALRESSGGPVHLSGAGPTLLCLVDDAGEGERVVDECARQGMDCRLVRTLAPGEGPRFTFD